MEYCSVIQKRMIFCHLQLHEWTWSVKSDRERQILYDIAYT